jgi:RimJ/RimL family protein N-acetyltransferase
VRPWTHDDVDAVISASHDPFIPTITNVPAEASLDDAHAFIDRAEMGYWTLADRRRGGAASEALDLAATWVLDNLAINRTSLFIESWNEASTRTAERAGFSSDGLMRAWETYDNGQPRDMLAFGRLPVGGEKEHTR